MTRMKMKGEAASWVLRILRFTVVSFVACASFIFGAYAAAQQAPAASIVGRWRSLETTKGGIGQIWEFRADGSFDFSMGADVEIPWRIENNQLILPPDAGDGPEQKCVLKWFGDNKVRLEADGGVVELTRVGNRTDSGNPIIGEWTETRDMGGHNVEYRYLFYPSGQLLLLIPFKFVHGSYTISGSTLHLEQGGQTSKSKFKLADNLLTISAPKGGQKSHYARY